jgi:colanic acid biosynthesis glycosyl transferase WcaI
VKVLVVGLNYSPEPTGIAPYTAGFCRGLVRRGHDVRVLTTMPHYPEWQIRDGYTGWSRRERLEGVGVTRFLHYVPGHPSGFRRLASEVTFGLRVLAARWERPDLVVFVSPALFASALGLIRARAVGVPSVVWVQDLYSLGIVETAGSRGGGLIARAVRRVESAALAAADGVCVIHARFAAVIEQLGVRPERVQIVRNWTHLPPSVEGLTREVRDRLGWRQGEVVALHSGAMGRKQNLANVVAAARLADRRGDPVRFVLMGNGGERAALEQSASGVRSISFVDPLPGDQYQAALAAADVLIVNEHAGLREMAVPSKLTSYFSSGRPIVAATDPGSVTASEVAVSGAGVRVAAGNPMVLLDAVLQLGTDTVRAFELGRRGRLYRDTVLSEDAALDTFTEWIETLPRVKKLGDRAPV